jgi:hypothetical protein
VRNYDLTYKLVTREKQEEQKQKKAMKRWRKNAKYFEEYSLAGDP